MESYLNSCLLPIMLSLITTTFLTVLSDCLVIKLDTENVKFGA